MIIEDVGIYDVESSGPDIRLLTIAYRLRNAADRPIGPMHMKLVFHHERLRTYLGDIPREYAPYERGNERPIRLEAGEAYQGGYSFEFAAAEAIEAAQLEAIVAKGDAVELLLVDTETERTIAREWIHQYEQVKE